MDEGMNEWVKVWIPSAMAGTRFPNNIIRNWPPWVRCCPLCGFRQALSSWGSYFLRAHSLTAPSTEKGVAFSSCYGEKSPGSALIGSASLLGHLWTNCCDQEEWGPLAGQAGPRAQPWIRGCSCLPWSHLDQECLWRIFPRNTWVSTEEGQPDARQVGTNTAQLLTFTKVLPCFMYSVVSCLCSRLNF